MSNPQPVSVTDDLMSGAEYLASLCDGRAVYLYGERVADVTTGSAVCGARVARVQAEIKRRAHRCHEQRCSFTPVIAARPADWIVIERRERGEVARGHRRLPWAHGKVTWQLGPPRCLHAEILASERELSIDKQAGRHCEPIVQRLQAPRCLLVRSVLGEIG